MQYDHTQKAPIHLILVGIGTAMFIGAWLTPEQIAQIILLCVGALVFVLAMCFRQLTVSDEGDRLRICFGPLPLFQRRILYADIESVQRSRSTILDGWGIHLSLSGGVVWNLWGFDCVDVYRKKGSKLRIGTDDPEGLETFLKRRVSEG
ncbi:unnamed protein product [marine sediment metagenome]|uniref:DUF304 domain-containing protein n=1 Tax=marine sediment metagenome TaxID=412755 RepID=X1EPC7_9ZZZZ